MTQDVDIILPSARIEEFLRVAAASGFEVITQNSGRWPKVLHQETEIMVDILPEGGRPGTASQPAPTTISHPSEMGASGAMLRYIQLPSLLELKLAAGRGRDESDVIELMRVNMDQTAVESFVVNTLNHRETRKSLSMTTPFHASHPTLLTSRLRELTHSSR